MTDSFLDLDIHINDDRYVTNVYHKVDDFDFEVVSFPFPTSSISDHITYNYFYSQLVRFSFICSQLMDIASRTDNLLASLIQRGLSKYRLKLSFSKFQIIILPRFGISSFSKFQIIILPRFGISSFS